MSPGMTRSCRVANGGLRGCRDSADVAATMERWVDQAPTQDLANVLEEINYAAACRVIAPAQADALRARVWSALGAQP